MKECGNIKENLIDYIDDQLSVELKATIRKHLDECSVCRKLLNEFKSIYCSVDESAEIDVSSGFYARLQSRVDEYEENHVSLSEFWDYITGKTRPVLASITVVGALIVGHLFGSGLINGSYAGADSEDTYVAEYYGMDEFSLSSETYVPEVYYNLIYGEDTNE
jgi:anti-sigma factor RsiW